MEDNPYSALLNMIQRTSQAEQPAAYRIGNVVSGDPLAVDVGGARQEYPSDLILLATAQVVEVIVDPEGQHSHPSNASISEAGRHKHTARVSRGLPSYEKGDKVLLIPYEDEQRYIVWGRLYGL